MDWLFIVGIAFDIAGGCLLAGPIVLVRRKEIAKRGALFPSGGPTLGKARELALSRVGLGLLATGFFLQLLGYVVSSGDAWFLAVAVLVMVAAALGGWWLAVRVAAPRIHARAKSDYEAMQGERERSAES